MYLAGGFPKFKAPPKTTAAIQEHRHPTRGGTTRGECRSTGIAHPGVQMTPPAARTWHKGIQAVAHFSPHCAWNDPLHESEA